MNGPVHPWLPVSLCGDSCLPAAGTVPAAGRLARLLRLLAVLLLVPCGMALAAVLPLLPARLAENAQRIWFRAVLGSLRIRLQVSGDARFAPRGMGVLVVSNHVSWLDLVALGAVQPVRLVAKSEVRGWPVVGLLARRSGAIFIQRERLRALPGTIGEIRTALGRATAVGAFPEATTWCGRSGGRFRPAVFQAAVDTAAPVRPVALRYLVRTVDRDGERTTTVPAFVGSATLWQALVLITGVRGLVVRVRLLPLIFADGADRHALAARAEAAVAGASRPSPVSSFDASSDSSAVPSACRMVV